MQDCKDSTLTLRRVLSVTKITFLGLAGTVNTQIANALADYVMQ
jgi:hypothetical protein